MIEIAQALQSIHSKEMLGRLRNWNEVSPAARTVWLNLAQLVIRKAADAIHDLAQSATAHSPPSAHQGDSLEAPDRGVGATRAAEMLGVNRRTLGRYVSKHGLSHWRTPGGHLRFNPEEITVWKVQSAATPKPSRERPLTAREIHDAQKRGKKAADDTKEWRAARRAKGLPT